MNCNKLTEANNLFEDLQGNNILFMFKGDFNQELINSIVLLVEGLPEVDSENLLVKSRLVAILVECLQNICRHGESMDEHNHMRPGILILRKIEGKFYITIGNILSTSKVEGLEKHIIDIKSKSNSQLKQFKKDVLLNTELYGKLGADFGLIHIARKVSKGFDFKFKKVRDNFSFFSLDLCISTS
jgi:hypothetical protein